MTEQTGSDVTHRLQQRLCRLLRLLTSDSGNRTERFLIVNYHCYIEQVVNSGAIIIDLLTFKVDDTSSTLSLTSSSWDFK